MKHFGLNEQALALLLAVSGVYAVVAFNVGQRQREMGIRLALGATPGEVRRLVIGRGMHTVGLGCAIGVVAAYPLVRLMGDVLFGVTPAEPLPYVIAPAALLATALVARLSARPTCRGVRTGRHAQAGLT